MKTNLITLSLGVGAMLLATEHAFADNNCAARTQIVDRLASHYGETRQSMGLGSDNALVELYASEETGSWTLTVTKPNGTTCLLASGKAFETVGQATVSAHGSDA
ncbi:MAG: hypothetical protein ABJO67_00515 [Pseudoruegeria sp.]